MGSGDGGTPEPEKNYYTVTWKNYENTILEVDEKVLEGTMHSFDGSTPIRNDSEQYYYQSSNRKTLSRMDY